MKKDGGNLIQHELLFETQDGEGNCTGLGLLFYCKGIPAYLLANQCTPLGIVNGTRAIVHRVVPQLIRNRYIQKIRSYNNSLFLSSDIYAVGTTKALRYYIFNGGRESIFSISCKINLNVARYQYY